MEFDIVELYEAPYIVFNKKSDEELARRKQFNVNAEALAYLNNTDWFVTRFAETGEPIPEEVKEKRAQFRSMIKTLTE